MSLVRYQTIDFKPVGGGASKGTKGGQSKEEDDDLSDSDHDEEGIEGGNVEGSNPATVYEEEYEEEGK